jgi:hypothetical protein
LVGVTEAVERSDKNFLDHPCTSKLSVVAIVGFQFRWTDFQTYKFPVDACPEKSII